MASKWTGSRGKRREVRGWIDGIDLVITASTTFCGGSSWFLLPIEILSMILLHSYPAGIMATMPGCRQSVPCCPPRSFCASPQCRNHPWPQQQSHDDDWTGARSICYVQGSHMSNVAAAGARQQQRGRTLATPWTELLTFRHLRRGAAQAGPCTPSTSRFEKLHNRARLNLGVAEVSKRKAEGTPALLTGSGRRGGRDECL
ncbi:hypothetical protein BDY21DRAFT_49153 [Lineolata rhizophorae]|uniref:Uncharacterized protein n=1 Tax=Lineolata rhizophorae TaxID=578093 RepID=A0A6A6NXE8_9PEZI|nr:hypothetical protein BDY21DRAFT_49153 [Lineolata rhizophorae]